MNEFKTNKLKSLREKMHLSERYVANLLGKSIFEYHLVENGEIHLQEAEIEMLCKVYGVNKKYFYLNVEPSDRVLARTHDVLSSNDKEKVAEFFNFQQVPYRNVDNKEYAAVDHR